ncbi:MAG TPA: serine/threonine-protein kinase [Pseudomonadota bacterium]|jgi:serine/threonine protein kinase|nr:serine/threonine protein kinase [Deltaproteobacteria bacterium]HPH26719.1 serine/threonine-protein kinase [Pseudomonadota bacterium]
MSSTESAADKLNPGSAKNPQSFGKYLLMGMIARGGMAEVYRARGRTAPSTGPGAGTARMYAIKCMRPQLAKEARFVEMFVREGKLAVLLDQPSIVRTYEIGRTDGRYFIAMEYIGGKDLTQILRRCQETSGRIPMPHACYITAKMCEGLHYAHTLLDADGKPLAIVNRDVSPSNVRIGYDGEVKLLDFGIAQAMVKFTSEIGVLKGKFSYMSPEQIRGMPVDARTDVFSTGIILHEMLTTEKLFRGDTEFQLMERVRNVDVLPPSKFNRRVPEALDRIVMKALARDVADRYQSAAELGADLQAFLAPYRFDPKEMKEHVRSLFRADYEAEAQEIQACMLASLPEDGGQDPSLGISGSSIEMIVSGSVSSAGMSSDSSDNVVQIISGNEPQSAPAAASAQTADARPSATASQQTAPEAPDPANTTQARMGFWARIKGAFGSEKTGVK